MLHQFMNYDNMNTSLRFFRNVLVQTSKRHYSYRQKKKSYVCPLKKNNIAKWKRWEKRERECLKEDISLSELEKNKINYHLGGKKVTYKNLISFLEQDKKLLLYVLCKIKEKRKLTNNTSLMDELFINTIEKLANKESVLNVKEKLIYLCCIDNKKYAERITLTKKEVPEICKQKNNVFKEHKEKEKLTKMEMKQIEQKNVFNYYSRILKNRKNALEEKEIEEDVLIFLQNKINKNLNNISLYLFNVSYLNRKIVMKTNVLFIFVLYLLKCIKRKIKKRMPLLHLFDYVEMLTSIIHVSKLKKENSLKTLSDLAQINRLKVLNQNEYIFDISHFDTWDKNIEVIKKKLLYNDRKFFHYYNIKEFVFNKEKNKKSNYNVDANNFEKKNVTSTIENNQYINTNNIKEKQCIVQSCDKLNSEIIHVIYFTNFILFHILKKFQKKIKTKYREKDISKVLFKFPIIINYIFECLQFDIFCVSLFEEYQQLISSLSEIYQLRKTIANKRKGVNNSEDNIKNFFSHFFPSDIIQLLHLISIKNISTVIEKKNIVEAKTENYFLEKCLEFLFIHKECKELGKKDLILLYQSVSKLLFPSKKIYLEKLNLILINQFINFTYQDLYNIVYSLKCSEYFDISFIEILLRNIYKLKHKFSQSQLFTIISIFYQFNTDLSIFNLLISYANRESLRNNINEDHALDEEKDDVTYGGKKLEEDLENKERILKELSSHIKKNSTEHFAFSESDLLELDSENVPPFDSSIEEKDQNILNTNTEEKMPLKKRKIKKKLK